MKKILTIIALLFVGFIPIIGASIVLSTITPTYAAPPASNSTDNSSTDPLADGETFTGSWELHTEPDVLVTLLADQNADLYIDFSHNAGVTVHETKAYSATADSYAAHKELVGDRWARVRVVNSSGITMTSMSLRTSFGSYSQPQPVGVRPSQLLGRTSVLTNTAAATTDTLIYTVYVTDLIVTINNATVAAGSYLMELRDHPYFSQFQQAAYAWRVVGAEYSQEDATVTRFRAYGLSGEHLPFATFGVNFAQAKQIGGGFRFQPWHGNKYYIPVDNKFATPNTGGYVVTVLDTEYPSECMAFGMDKSGQQHKCLVISFRLMPFDFLRYPNDV